MHWWVGCGWMGLAGLEVINRNSSSSSSSTECRVKMHTNTHTELQPAMVLPKGCIYDGRCEIHINGLGKAAKYQRR